MSYYCNISYQCLDVVNKGFVENHIRGGIVKKPFIKASRWLDEMIKIKKIWYTSEEYVSLPHFREFKEQVEKTKSVKHTA